jgi:hypothetical protein
MFEVLYIVLDAGARAAGRMIKPLRSALSRR